MLENFKKFLVFFRLVDEHDGLISLTNVTMMVALYKIGSTDISGSMNDIIVLVTALLSYNGKKLINKSNE